MERMQGVPVLQSLASHAIYQCGECAHILLMQEEQTLDWSAGWLHAIPVEFGRAITCASLFEESAQELRVGAG
jgi:hypothetical protein